MLPLTRVRIVGPSMEPALANDEWWLVRRTSRIRPGDVILLARPGRPGLLVVKRAVREVDDGWWVEGDNAEMSDDSRQFGVVPPTSIVGRLWIRYHPLRRVR